MALMADKTELLQLKKEIERHNKLYHEQDNPEISDAEYDALYQRLKELENLLGADQDSPTQQVGAPSSRKFEKHNHLKPMLSLSNVFSDEDFYKFEERVLKRLNTDKTIFSVEPKFDGIGISLTYENGKLSKAVTRGDGETG